VTWSSELRTVSDSGTGTWSACRSPTLEQGQPGGLRQRIRGNPVGKAPFSRTHYEKGSDPSFRDRRLQPPPWPAEPAVARRSIPAPDCTSDGAEGRRGLTCSGIPPRFRDSSGPKACLSTSPGEPRPGPALSGGGQIMAQPHKAGPRKRRRLAAPSGKGKVRHRRNHPRDGGSRNRPSDRDDWQARRHACALRESETSVAKTRSAEKQAVADTNAARRGV
jgi:hypothetical protein